MLDALLGLGSNLGDRHGHLENALTRLRAAMRVTAVSSIYETAPVGLAEQPAFLNMVVRVNTPMSPFELLHALLAIERSEGRDRANTQLNGPRTLDLDLLLATENGAPVFLDGPELTIPHPRLHERRFVLGPAAEIAPEFVHPLLQNTMAELLGLLCIPVMESDPNHPSRVVRNVIPRQSI